MKHTQKILFTCLLLNYFFARSQVNLSNGLTACYSLNGHANESINALNGTLSGVTAVADHAGNPGAALSFSGSPQSVVHLPNSSFIKPSPAVSISAWYKITEFINYPLIVFAKNQFFSYNTSYAFTIQDGGDGYKFAAWRQNGGNSDYVVGTSTIALDVWYHVVFTIDNSSMSIYVDGQHENTISASITSFNYDADRGVVLGGSGETNYDVPFKGSIDNLRFYSRLLNSSEVSALFTQDASCESVPTSLSSTSLKGGELNLQIYPNPFTREVTIASEAPAGLTLEFYNVLGGKLKEIKTDDLSTTVNLNDFDPGIYFVRVYDAGHNLLRQEKLIKQSE